MSTSHKACILIQPFDGFQDGKIEVVKNYKGRETMGKTSYRADYPGKANHLRGQGGFNLDGGVLYLDVGEWDLGGLERVPMEALLQGYKDVPHLEGTGQLRYGGGEGRLYQKIAWTVIDVIDASEEHHKKSTRHKKKRKQMSRAG